MRLDHSWWLKEDREMDDSLIIVTPSTAKPGSSEFGSKERSPRNVDPRSIDLPGPNWSCFSLAETSLTIVEMTTSTGSTEPRPRKRVHANLATGVCTSYVLNRKISDATFTTKSDVECCVEELDMMNVCAGGPPASDYPGIKRTNACVDSMGNWRHNMCKITTRFTESTCKACERLSSELVQPAPAAKPTKPNDDAPSAKRIRIGNLSHRKQSQIICLRKRRLSWYRKRREADKQMQLIEEMISEISGEPENSSPKYHDDDDDDDDDDE